jgi:hypothetical protein
MFMKSFAFRFRLDADELLLFVFEVPADPTGLVVM